jgi:hypothetical protein
MTTVTPSPAERQNGILSQNLELECAAVPGLSSVQAFAHTSAGTVVKTPFVDKPTPCG